jgi:hypothetical protein
MKGYGHVEFATAEAAQKVNNLLTNLYSRQLSQLLDQKTSLWSSSI